MTRPKLFLIDDNRADGMLLDLAFSDAGKAVEIVQAHDGLTALAFLRGAVRITPFPYRLIVVDLNIPRVDGRELIDRLHEMAKTWPELAAVPIVILTSSTNPADRQRTWERQPGAYLVKPDDYHGMAEVVDRLAVYLFPEAAAAAAPVGLP